MLKWPHVSSTIGQTFAGNCTFSEYFASSFECVFSLVVCLLYMYVQQTVTILTFRCNRILAMETRAVQLWIHNTAMLMSTVSFINRELFSLIQNWSWVLPVTLQYQNNSQFKRVYPNRHCLYTVMHQLPQQVELTMMWIDSFTCCLKWTLALGNASSWYWAWCFPWSFQRWENQVNRHLLLLLLLGRLFDRVDLIKPVSNVRPYMLTYTRTYVHKKFLKFQWNLACR